MTKFLFFLYQWLIAVPILFVITVLTALVTIIGTMLGSHRICGYWPAHIWSICVCKLMFVRVKVTGRENLKKSQSYVFVANHQGAFDIWAILGYIGHNFKWLMKKSLEKIPLVGFACKKAGYVFVDDSSIHGIKETISEAENRLKGGMSVVIFPEGTRCFDGKLQPFKRGAFMLAAEFRLPVVPVTISGSFHVLPRTTYNITPGLITLTIHPPIYPGENGFNTRKLMSDCQQAILSSLPSAAQTDTGQ